MTTVDTPHPAAASAEDQAPNETVAAAPESRPELLEERQRSLGYLRRALLAEHAGTLVPELVAGETPEALEASIAVAQAAFVAARQTALDEMQRAAPPAPAPVPAGTPPRDAVPDARVLTPFQKIASGLRR